jgi:4-hydroxybenzoate polyprenyltransferase
LNPLLEKLRTLAATARLANVPSVASNVGVGAFIALAVGSTAAPARFPLAAATGVCLYLAGNFLNDWADRRWDARHRPERALPRGLFPPALFLCTAIALLMLGMGLASKASPAALLPAAAITTLILLYTAIHKRSAWSVIPMGLCRGLLPPLGFLACMDHPARTAEPTDLAWLAAAGAALFFHIVGLSLSARHESTGKHLTRWLAHPFFAIAAVCSAAPAAWSLAVTRALGSQTSPAMLLLAAFAYVVWIVLCHTSFRQPTARRVSGLLAGIPLVDCLSMLPIAFMMPHTPVALLTISPLAFLAGLALQRLTPAT